MFPLDRLQHPATPVQKEMKIKRKERMKRAIIPRDMSEMKDK